MKRIVSLILVLFLSVFFTASYASAEETYSAEHRYEFKYAPFGLEPGASKLDAANAVGNTFGLYSEGNDGYYKFRDVNQMFLGNLCTRITIGDRFEGEYQIAFWFDFDITSWESTLEAINTLIEEYGEPSYCYGSGDVLTLSGRKETELHEFDEETLAELYNSAHLSYFYMYWENVELYFAYMGDSHFLNLYYHLPLL